MALSKPFTAARGNAADVDLMLDELYQAVQDLESRVTAFVATPGPSGPRGFSGTRGVDGERGPRGLAGGAGNLANPTATIGLTAVTGAALTAMRSDGAPALGQGIAPTWTAAHTFSELIVANKGLTFPATQVASAGANDLDDYEEGSWTPIIGGATSESGQTYLAQVGRYVKLGKLVCVMGYAQLSVKGTITGNVRMKGLPFTIENTLDEYAAGSVQWANLALSLVTLVCRADPNNTGLLLFGATGATVSNTTQLVPGDLLDTVYLILAQSYRAAA